MKKIVKVPLLLILMLSLLLLPVLATTGAVNATLNYRNIKILVDEKEITPVDVSGASTEPFIMNNSAYLPVRAISEALGYDVNWNDATSTISIGVQNASESITADPNCDFKVVTLGTGAPPPETERFGPCVYAEVNGKHFLFDVGRGALQRLYQIGVSANTIDMVFITHLHSDHTVGLADLYLTGMLNGAFGMRHKPFLITGVEGTKSMMDYLKLAYSADIEIRMNDGEMEAEWTDIITKEFTKDGIVFDEDGVTVTAFENFHGEYITPSYGYRIDYDGRSVVISGDTKYCENVVENSKGVDLLIHSVGMSNEELLKQDTVAAEKARIILNHHTTPEEAARVFNETTPKLAVFNHMVIVSTDPKFAKPTQEEIFDRTREYGYTGPLEIARDLMTFEIGETVRVIPFQG